LRRIGGKIAACKSGTQRGNLLCLAALAATAAWLALQVNDGKDVLRAAGGWESQDHACILMARGLI
jgi:hypothetical protein